MSYIYQARTWLSPFHLLMIKFTHFISLAACARDPVGVTAQKSAKMKLSPLKSLPMKHYPSSDYPSYIKLPFHGGALIWSLFLPIWSPWTFYGIRIVHIWIPSLLNNTIFCWIGLILNSRIGKKTKSSALFLCL